MWISSNLPKLNIYFVGFLTRDPSLIWNTANGGNFSMWNLKNFFWTLTSELIKCKTVQMETLNSQLKRSTQKQ